MNALFELRFGLFPIDILFAGVTVTMHGSTHEQTFLFDEYKDDNVYITTRGHTDVIPLKEMVKPCSSEWWDAQVKICVVRERLKKIHDVVTQDSTTRLDPTIVCQVKATVQEVSQLADEFVIVEHLPSYRSLSVHAKAIEDVVDAEAEEEEEKEDTHSGATYRSLSVSLPRRVVSEHMKTALRSM